MTDYTIPSELTSDSQAPGSAWFNQVRSNGEAIHRPPRARFIAMSSMDPSRSLADTNASPIASGTSGSIYWVATRAGNGDTIDTIASFGNATKTLEAFQYGIAGDTTTAQPFLGSTNSWTGGTVNDPTSGQPVTVTDAIGVPADGLYLVTTTILIATPNVAYDIEIEVAAAAHDEFVYTIPQGRRIPITQVVRLTTADNLRVMASPGNAAASSAGGFLEITRIGDV